MNKPEMEQEGLTYVWECNAWQTYHKVVPGKGVVVGPAGIDYPKGSRKMIEGAIVGRPVGSEDFIPQELKEQFENFAIHMPTVEQNTKGHIVGVYVPAPN